MTGTSLISMVIPFLILIFALICKNSLMQKNLKNIILFNLVYISFLFNILQFKIMMIGRFTYYYYIFVIILIPEVISSLKNVWLRLFLSSLIVICCLLYNLYYLNIGRKSGSTIQNFFKFITINNKNRLLYSMIS